MTFNLEQTEDWLEEAKTDKDIALPLAYDIMNICGFVAVRMYGKNNNVGYHQAEIAIWVHTVMEQLGFQFKDRVLSDELGENFDDDSLEKYTRKCDEQVADSKKWDAEYGDGWWKKEGECQ